MKLKKYLPIVISIAVLLPVGTMSQKRQPLSVSLIQLIANPEKYHNRLIRVEGVIHCKFENSALYVSRDDADYLIGRNAIWVRYNSERVQMQFYNPQSQNIHDKPDYENLNRFHNKRVLLEGIFNQHGSGHRGAYSGEIRNVTRIMELIKFSEE